jgi:hypothetical protein
MALLICVEFLGIYVSEWGCESLFTMICSFQTHSQGIWGRMQTGTNMDLGYMMQLCKDYIGEYFEIFS